jgi:hypothetical protein
MNHYEIYPNIIENDLQLSQMTNFLSYLFPNNAVFELCVIKPQKRNSALWGNQSIYGKDGIAVGYFTNKEEAAAIAIKLDHQTSPECICVSLNPCYEGLLGRADHKIKANINRTQDADITIINNILIDIDPVRPNGISSSDAEHDQALNIGKGIMSDLITAGWPEPFLGDSGNGVHLILKTQGLPNNKESVETIKKFIEAIGHHYSDYSIEINTSIFKYSNVKIDIDQKVFNPSRLVKFYGTHARKGDNIPNRPHRLSRIISMPGNPQPVAIGHLKAFTQTVPTTTKCSSPDTLTTSSPKPNILDVEAYLRHYGREVVKIIPYENCTLFCLAECVFDPTHGPNEAAVGQNQDGKLFYKCFHNSCRGKTWEEARKIISRDDNLNQFIPNVIVINGSIEIPAGCISARELLQLDIPDSQPLVQNILGEQESTLIYGAPGLGKSLFAVYMSLVIGNPHRTELWNFPIQNSISTLIVQAENSIKATQKRIKLMIQEEPELANGVDAIHFPYENSDIRIFGDLNDYNFQAFLRDKLQETGAGLLVIDPLISYHNNDENDNRQMRRTLDTLTQLSNDHKISILVIHHPSKNYNNRSSTSRGATSLIDWAHNIFILEKDKNPGLIKVTCQKSRNFEVIPPFSLQKTKNLRLFRVDPNNLLSPTGENACESVVNALQKLGGSVTKQADLVKQIMTDTGTSRTSVQNQIEKAIHLQVIRENNLPGKKQKGYALTLPTMLTHPKPALFWPN